jgi:hypothetical protein
VGIGTGDPVIRRSARSLRQQREVLEQVARAFATESQPGSPCLEDRRALAPRRRTTAARAWILAETCRQASRITSNVTDHIAGLERCLAGDLAPVYSPMTLSRAVLDGCARVCHVLDSDASLETRLLRGAALLLDSSQEELAAVRTLPPDRPPMPGALKVVTRMHGNTCGWITSAGMDIRSDRGGRVTGLAWGTAGKAVPVKINVSSEAERYFPEVPAAYRMGSGIAHSAPWMLHDVDDLPSIIYMIGAVALVCLNCCIKVVEAYAWYYGHDSVEQTRSGMLRCQAVTNALTDFARAGHNSLGRYADDRVPRTLMEVAM